MDIFAKLDALKKSFKKDSNDGVFDLIIVGLGNIGTQYSLTRHNIGFVTIDELSKRHSIQVNRCKHKGMIGTGEMVGKRVMLVKPQTFMNESGQCVKEILEYYKLNSNKIIVIYDDIDIDVGTIRVRKSGSAGTHNGMRSIIYQIKSDDFARVRIGIGKPKVKGYNLADYVLGKFSNTEMGKMGKAVESAANAVEEIVANDVETAMNKYNGK